MDVWKGLTFHIVSCFSGTSLNAVTFAVHTAIRKLIREKNLNSRIFSGYLNSINICWISGGVKQGGIGREAI